MKKTFFKFATNFGPLAIFFFVYYNSGKNLIIAIPPLIIATLVSLAVIGFFKRKPPAVAV